jgi:hypothetical protein
MVAKHRGRTVAKNPRMKKGEAKHPPYDDDDLRNSSEVDESNQKQT